VGWFTSSKAPLSPERNPCIAADNGS